MMHFIIKYLVDLRAHHFLINHHHLIYGVHSNFGSKIIEEQNYFNYFIAASQRHSIVITLVDELMKLHLLNFTQEALLRLMQRRNQPRRRHSLMRLLIRANVIVNCFKIVIEVDTKLNHF